ncbi:hypothetical protein pb186bvf_015343 [Paramecium bursaria]
MNQDYYNLTPQKGKNTLAQRTTTSTCLHSPIQELYSNSVNPWKTPKSLLKSNQSEKSPDNNQKSPYSDRYIPFRQDDIARNLFNIQPFETESNSYQELLSENMLQIQGDENILQFAKKQEQPKQQKQLEPKRKIENCPIKVLDAPGLEDDFYQDTLHWGHNNMIAVGLQRSVFVYNVSTQKVSKLAPQQSVTQDQAYYTAVQWNTNAGLLAIGCFDGFLNFYDINKMSLYQKHQFSKKRISCITWQNPNIFAYGCKDKTIVLGDIRTPLVRQVVYENHSQEVCGITFDTNEYQLASGGNDNKVCIWQMRGTQPLALEINSHKAAVRALAWNPYSSGILATGGGNNDKTIKIHNTLSNTLLSSNQVDSQVCKLRYSRSVNELVSTHGYEKNLINIWSIKNHSLKKSHQLEGHLERVLYLSASPDETTILTGSGDETIKFWKVFPTMQNNSNSQLFQMSDIR